MEPTDRAHVVDVCRAHHGGADRCPLLRHNLVERRRIPTLVHQVLDTLLAQLNHIRRLHANRHGRYTARGLQTAAKKTTKVYLSTISTYFAAGQYYSQAFIG